MKQSRYLTAVCVLLSALVLAGCWNYRGLNTIDIVTGIAVDKDPQSGDYLLTFEIVDVVSASEDGQVKATYVESAGPTLFDAIRNSKMKLINKLYGGNMQTLIVSRQIAQTEGVSSVLEELIRDGEPRETMSVAISRQDTAKEILMAEAIDARIISYEVHKMLREDNRITASTKNIPLYMAYNAIKGTGNALVLPALECTQNSGETVVQAGGIAVFSGDRLIGFKDAQQTMPYLFMVDEVEGGVLSFGVGSPPQMVSTEIKHSRSRRKVQYENGQVTVIVDITVELNLMELKGKIDVSDAQHREDLEQLAAQVVEKQVAGFFKEVQTQNRVDIFGLGRLLYQKQPNLWRSIEEDWDKLFEKAQIEVHATADILTAGVLKNY